MTAKSKPMAVNDTVAACAWCENRFKSRRRGSRQRFCAARCRAAFWSALRSFGERALASGALTVADLQNGRAEACTLRAADERWSPVLSTGLSSSAPLARFVIEIPQALIHKLVIAYFELADYELDDVLALLTAPPELVVDR